MNHDLAPVLATTPLRAVFIVKTSKRYSSINPEIILVTFDFLAALQLARQPEEYVYRLAQREERTTWIDVLELDRLYHEREYERVGTTIFRKTVEGTNNHTVRPSGVWSSKEYQELARSFGVEFVASESDK